MHVLVVGYGKIGRIKASIWSSLGAVVTVYDRKLALKSLILRDGYKCIGPTTRTYDIIDISTPASTHFDAFKWAINHAQNPKIYLIEKPLASTRAELNSFKTLLADKPELQNKVYLNESYYQSKLVNEVATSIRTKKNKIKSVRIELSKNRLTKVDAGRFFDKHLEAIGIEVPHMIALLDKFDISVPTNAISTLIIDKQERINQAFILQSEYSNTNPAILLESYLGDFRYEGDIISNNLSTKRKMIIETDSLNYHIEFDPLSNHERFYSKLSIFKNSKVVSEKLVLDDHLKSQLRLFINGNYAKCNDSIGIEKALENSEILLNIRELSTLTELNIGEYDKSKLNIKNMEYTYGTRNQ